jgi:hypothetical protein
MQAVDVLGDSRFYKISMLDRTDEIVPPSTDVGSLDMIYAAPATAEAPNATELTSRKGLDYGTASSTLLCCGG